MRIAVIDIGTVSTRLLLHDDTPGNPGAKTQKKTCITNLGEGVDAAGMISAAAIARVAQVCAEYMVLVRAFAPQALCVTLTSAARDAANGGDVLEALQKLGVRPQIISGEIEARLSFAGAARDFVDEPLVVADSGGGSTELAAGVLSKDGGAELAAVQSYNIGCRRVTERFLAGGKPSHGQIRAAYLWTQRTLEPFWQQLGASYGRLVCVGGTVTTLYALTHKLEPYLSERVHLGTLSLVEVKNAIDILAVRTEEEIAALPGVQPSRAPVLLGGAVVVHEIMCTGGFDQLTVSESSLMAGTVAAVKAALCDREFIPGWKPLITSII